VGNTKIETALKACMALMNKGNINEGKSLILKEAHSKLKLIMHTLLMENLIVMAVKIVHFMLIFSHI